MSGEVQAEWVPGRRTSDAAVVGQDLFPIENRRLVMTNELRQNKT